MSSMQQRKAEILAKRAKLAELKRQRELRQHEFGQTRATSGDASEVWNTVMGDGAHCLCMLMLVASIGCVAGTKSFR